MHIAKLQRLLREANEDSEDAAWQLAVSSMSRVRCIVLRYFKGNKADVDDVVQEALIHLAKKAHHWRSEFKWDTFAAAVTRNFVINDSIKKCNKSSCLESIEGSKMALPITDNGYTELCKKELYNILYDCMKCLAAEEPRVADILKRYYFMGQSQAEIGAEWNISQPGVGNRLIIARCSLRAMLEEFGIYSSRG